MPLGAPHSLAATSAALAKRLLGQKQPALALAAAEQALRGTPDSTDLLELRATLLMHLGQPRAARVGLERLWQAGHRPDGMALTLARLARLAADPEGEANWLEQAGTETPAQMARIDLLRRSGQVTRARSALTEVLNGHSEAPSFLRRREAMLWRAQGRLDTARAGLTQHLKSHPADHKCRADLARTLRAMGDPAQADHLLDEGLARAPAQPVLRLAKAAGAMAEAAPQRALAELDHLTSEQAARPNAALRRAVARRAGGQAQAALTALTQLARRHPDMPEIALELAATQRLCGDVPGAAATLADLDRRMPGAAGLPAALMDHAEETSDATALTALATRAASGQWLAPQAAPVLARCLALLPARTADPRVVTLAAQARHLAPRQALQMALLADQQGLPEAASQFLTAALGRAGYTGHETVALVQAAHAAGADWARLAGHLIPRIPARDREAPRLEILALTEGPDAALAARARRRIRRPLRDILGIAMLLTQAGRLALAARYLRRALRQHPRDPDLLQRLLLAQIGSGAVAEARALVDRLAQGTDPGDDALVAVAARGCIALGDSDRARQLIAGLTDPRQKLRLRDISLRLCLRQGDRDATEVALEEIRQSGARDRTVHLNPSILGVELTESRLAEEPTLALPTAQAAQYLGPALRTLDTHVPTAPDGPTPPPQVMQYWNTGAPPDSVARIMRSWQAVPGLDYHVFDKRQALRFLADRFDLGWATALNMATHPAQESDFFRLCWLAAEGGIYADCDDRLIGDWQALIATPGAVVYREPLGAIANNVIQAPRAHPLLIEAAVAAKTNLLNRDNDSIWSKTGPGLMTRAVGSWLAHCEAEGINPRITLRQRYDLGGVVQIHTPAPYKQTAGYWNAKPAARVGGLLQRGIEKLPTMRDVSQQRGAPGTPRRAAILPLKSNG